MKIKLAIQRFVENILLQNQCIDIKAICIQVIYSDAELKSNLAPCNLRSGVMEWSRGVEWSGVWS